MSTLELESKSTRVPTVIRPESGRTNPATQFSNVVFPHPDGPSSIVKPADVSNSASKVKALESRQVTRTDRGVPRTALSSDTKFATTHWRRVGETAQTRRLREYVMDSVTSENAMSSSAR